MLDSLNKARVFSVRVVDDKKRIRIEEECDNHYSKDLTKEEAQELIDDLQKIVNSMI